MALDSKEIDLIIRAQLKGGKTIEDVTKSIKELEVALEKQSVAAKKGEGSIDELRATLLALQTVQDRLKDQAGLVGNFNKLTSAVASSEQKVKDSFKAWFEYKAKVDAAGQATERQVARLDNLNNRVLRSQDVLAKQRATLAELQQTLQQAGVDTNNLAGAEDRLRQSAAQVGISIGKAQSAIKGFAVSSREARQEQARLREEQGRVNDAVNAFNNNGRTSLSLLQRFRGQVLSLTAAYVSLFGAIEGIKATIDTVNTKQGIINQLSLANGNDPRKTADDYEYLRGQAERLGISFEQLAKGYAKFAASAKLAGSTTPEIRYIFETFAEVGRVANLSTEQLDGVFKALEQIISKGSIQAEELRGQLGDRLFGAFQVAAEALKDQFPDLNKALKDGLVTSDQLIKIAEKYRETVANQLPAATQSLAASQQRLNTELFNFRDAVGEAGLTEGVRKVTDEIVRLLQAEDGVQLAKSLGEAFKGIADSIVFLIRHLDELKIAFQVVGTVWASRQFLALGSSLGTAIQQIRAMNIALTSTVGLMGAVVRATALVTAAIVGWEIGKYLSDKFVEVRMAGLALVLGFEELWVRIKYGALILWEEVPNAFMDGMSAIVNILTAGMRSVLEVFSKGARAVGNTDLASSIDKIVGQLTLKTSRLGNASGKLTQQMLADLERIRQVGTEMFMELDNPGATAPGGRKAGAQTTRPADRKSNAVKADEKAAQQRANLREQLENQIATIEAKIERQEKESLTRRLAAIDIQYTALLNKIRKLGGADGAELEARLSTAVAELKRQEIKRFNEDILKEQQSLQQKLEQVEAAGGRKQKQDLQARLDAVKTQYDETYRDIAAFRDRLLADGRDTTTADLMKQRLDAGIAELQNAERKQFYLDELKRREQAINNVLEERQSRIKVLTTQQEAGLLSEQQVWEKSKQIIADTQPKLEALVLEAQDFATTNSAAFDPATLAAFNAKLIEAQNSAAGLRTELFTVANLSEMLAGGLETAFDSAAKAIGDAVAGVSSWSDALKATRNAVLNFAAEFLREIAKMILKQTLLNMLQSASGSGGFLGSVAGFLNGFVKHSGGVMNGSGTTRSVPASWFANAPRYHTGGIAGLAPDEYPAILKKNEEVLTQSDPRNVLNGGAQAPAAGQNIKIMNMIDSGSVVSEGLSSQEGEKAIYNFIRANRTGIRSLLGA